AAGKRRPLMMDTPATLAGFRCETGAAPKTPIPATGHCCSGRRLGPAACAAFGLSLLLAPGCGPPSVSTAVPAARPVRATAAALQGGTTAASAPAETVWGGPQLYARYCAACHGEAGGGDGPAARFLFP